jgi:hypothetical protein
MKGKLVMEIFQQKTGLKVVGKEKNGGSRRRQMLSNGLGPWRSRFTYLPFEHAVFD